MGSADFRIIPHPVMEAVLPENPDLYRFLISYVTSNPPQYVALDKDSCAYLVSDDKSAARFPTAESAQHRLTQILESRELPELRNPSD